MNKKDNKTRKINNNSPRNLKRTKKKEYNTFKKKKYDKFDKDIKYYNYLLTITYDGTTFGGYAKQKFSNTIEEKLGDVLDEHLGEHIKIVNASRTDAKVHAVDQKVMFKYHKKINFDKFNNYMSENLPSTIDILNIERVDDKFHARYDVINKTYIYKIHTMKNIFLNNYSYFLDIDDIDVQKINQICSHFVGEKDFVGFCSKKKDAKSTIRTVNYFNFKKVDENNYIFEINADGFLYNMIRIIIAAILEWYEKGYSDSKILEIINSLDHDLTKTKISPSGLYLYKINYN